VVSRWVGRTQSRRV